jgi:hypothetical protein
VKEAHVPTNGPEVQDNPEAANEQLIPSADPDADGSRRKDLDDEQSNAEKPAQSGHAGDGSGFRSAKEPE